MARDLPAIVDLASQIARRMDAGDDYSDLDKEMIRLLTPLIVDGPEDALSRLTDTARETPEAEDVVRAYACNLSLNVTAQAQTHDDRWTTRMTLLGIPIHLTPEPGASVPRYFTESLHETALTFRRHQLVLPSCSVILCGGLFNYDDLAAPYGQWRRWSVSLAGILAGDTSTPDLPAPSCESASGGPVVRYLVGMIDRGNGCFLDRPADALVRERLKAWREEARDHIVEIDTVADASVLAPEQLDDALVSGSDLVAGHRDTSAA